MIFRRSAAKRSGNGGSPCKVNQYTSQSRGESTPNPIPSLTHSNTQHPMLYEGVFSDPPLSLSLSLTLSTAVTSLPFESLLAPPSFLSLSHPIYRPLVVCLPPCTLSLSLLHTHKNTFIRIPSIGASSSAKLRNLATLLRNIMR